jgi:hypothetical protein
MLQYNTPELPIDPNNIDEPALDFTSKGKTATLKQSYSVKDPGGRRTGVIGRGTAGYGSAYQTSVISS